MGESGVDLRHPTGPAGELSDPAALAHIGWVILAGEPGRAPPPLGEVMRLLRLLAGAHDAPPPDAADADCGWDEYRRRCALHGLGGALYEQARAWVESCHMRGVGDLRVRVQLARAVWALHTLREGDDPDFTTIPAPCR